MMKNIFTSVVFLLLIITGIKAQFIEGPIDGVCVGETYTYTLVGSNAYDVTWEIFPPGQSDIVEVNDTTIEVTFNSPGFHVINVYNTDQQLIIATEVYVFNVSAEIAIISGCYEEGEGMCNLVCTGSEITIASIDSIARTNGSWEIQGAESYEVINGNLLVTWGPAGSGYVIYSDTTGRCSASDSLCFEIYEKATATINTSPAAINDTIYSCINEEITFQGEGNNGIGYSWDMGDGSTYNKPNVIHSYQSPGSYLVNFYVDGVCSCDADTSITVIVEDTEKPQLECYGSACPGDMKTYSLPDVDCDLIEWSISSNGEIISGGNKGDNSIKIQWNSGPKGIIEVDVSNCSEDYCKNILKYTIPLITPDGPISGNKDVCSGSIETYTAPFFDGVIYDWNVGPVGEIIEENGSNFVIIKWGEVSTAYTETVSVTYDNCVLKCGGADEMKVTIKPNFSIESIVKVCQGEPATAVTSIGPEQGGPSVIVDWELIDENGNIVASNPDADQWSYIFNLPPGKYTWRATSHNSPDVCNKIVEKTILVVKRAEQPLGIIGETEICPGKAYSYDIKNAGDYGTEWIVTDGANTTTYTGSAITHTFGNVPPYKIEAKHFHTTDPKCSSEAVNLTINELQLDKITGTSEVCEESIDTFKIEEIGGVSYNWSLTDSTKAELRKISPTEVVVFFSEAGITELNVEACGKSISKSITVNPSSSLIVNHPDALCIGNTATVTTNQSSTLHSWYNDENSIIATGPSAEVGPGSYSVIYVNQYGCSTTQYFTIYKRESPVAEITANKRPDYTGPSPDLKLIASQNAGYSFEWFKDGVSTGNTGPTLHVTQDGDYYVLVTNASGCTVKSNVITVQSCAVAGTCVPQGPGGSGGCDCLPFDFGLDKTVVNCAEHRYTFDNNNVDAGTAFVVISKFGDPKKTVLTGSDVSHIYDSPGIYEITAFGEIDTFSYPANFCAHFETIIDTVEAVANFEYDQACIGDTTKFYNRSRSLPFVNITSYNWNFDDPSSGNNTSTIENPIHIFNSMGDHQVSLEISTDSGCTTAYSEVYSGSGGPDFQLTYDSQNCEREATEFSINKEVFDVIWDFGDPGSGAENAASKLHVFHEYTSAGNYQFTVSGKDIYGCKNMEMGMIEVSENNLTGDITATPSKEACEGSTIDLQAPMGGVRWNWNTSDTTEQISVEVSGQYSVLLTDNNNCTYETDPIYVEFQPKPILNAQVRKLSQGNAGFWQDSIQVCYGTSVQIGASSDQLIDLEWADGNKSFIRTFAEANGNLLSPGSHTFIANGISINSACPAEADTVKIVVLPPPSKPDITLAAGNGCSMNMNRIEVLNPQPDLEYIWSTGHIGLSIVTGKSGEYFVTAVNENGCKTRSSVIEIKESPDINQIPSGCLKICELDTVCLPILKNIATYTIYKNGEIYAQGTDLPSYFIPDDYGEYVVELTSDNGCIVRSSPLILQYEAAYGTIKVPVYVDSDRDSTLNPSVDTRMQGIYVNIYNLDLNIEFSDTTLSSGYAEFENVPSGKYLISFNLGKLDSMYSPIIDSVMVMTDFCNDTTAVLSPGLLYGKECDAEVELSYTICPGDSVTVFGTTYYEEDIYEIQSGGYCDTTYFIDIRIPQLEKIELDPVQPIVEGTSIKIHHNYEDSTHYSFEWSPAAQFNCSACSSPYFTAPGTSTGITVHLESPEGCMLQDSIFIEVLQINQVYIPNVFTPNNDQINDRFMPFTGGTFSDVKLQIFNRWGDKIYEELAPGGVIKGWNGENSTGKALPGVYMYKVEYRLDDGKLEIEKGDVTLIR